MTRSNRNLLSRAAARGYGCGLSKNVQEAYSDLIPVWQIEEVKRPNLRNLYLDWMQYFGGKSAFVGC
jgi:hypothetical protein